MGGHDASVRKSDAIRAVNGEVILVDNRCDDELENDACHGRVLEAVLDVAVDVIRFVTMITRGNAMEVRVIHGFHYVGRV